MISINQLNIVVGFSVAYFSNYWFLQASHSNAEWVQKLAIDQYTWRWMLGIETIPALLFFFLLLKIPESPRWLVLRNRIDEAKSIMSMLSNTNDIDSAIKDIQYNLPEHSATLLTRIKQLFKPNMRLALLLGITVGVTQQITGVNAVYFYAPSIFEQSGIGTDAAFAQAIWVGIINVVFTIIAMLLIDRLGRRPLLIVGLTGVLVSMSICAYGFKTASYRLDPAAIATIKSFENESRLAPVLGKTFDNDVQFKSAVKNAIGEKDWQQFKGELLKAGTHMNPTLVLIGILGFVASFAVSLGPVMWVLLAEIFPNQLRAVAISFVGLINSGVSFGVQLLFPWELSHIGAAWTFLIYGLFALIGLLVVIKLLPETKGQSLEQLERSLTTGHSYTGKKQTNKEMTIDIKTGT